MASYPAEALEREQAEGTDYRTPFQRDHDRIIYSSAFRRLAGKTQVVSAGEFGDYHTRMTHSIKVAQVGRRLAQVIQQRAVEREAAGRRKEEYPTPDPDLVEAACLAHDLGHPPFGHAGEQALMAAVDDIVRKEFVAKATRDRRGRTIKADQQRFGGFEGNAQTFRLLVRLSARPPRSSRGLNLTRGTLDATMKYPWLRSEGRKWNVYPDDADDANWVREGSPPLKFGARKSFEAYVMDWADDVTYACHDMEDFYRAGLIPLQNLFAFPPEDQESRAEESLPEETRRFFGFVERKWLEKGRPWDIAAASKAWNDLAQLLVVGPPYEGSRTNKAELHRGISRVITYLLDDLKWGREGTEWAGFPYRHEGELIIGSGPRLVCDLMQELIWFYVIERPALQSQQYGYKRVVRDLLQIYYDTPDLLPLDRQEEREKDKVSKLRAATDHVASLTDSGALALHQRLTGIRPGAHSDNTWRV